MAATTLDNVELAAQRLEFELAAQEPKTLFPAFFVQLRRVLGIAFEQWLRACLLSPLPQLHVYSPLERLRSLTRLTSALGVAANGAPRLKGLLQKR